MPPLFLKLLILPKLFILVSPLFTLQTPKKLPFYYKT